MNRYTRLLRALPSRHSLAARQMLLTLGFAALVGLVTGAIELVSEWHAWRDQVRQTSARDLDLIRASAAEAAFQLNTQQADNVVAGLLNSDTISRVRLRDNFGTLLSERSSGDGGRNTSWLGDKLLAGMATQRLNLVYRDPRDGEATPVGQLDITLDAGVVGQRFLGLAIDKLLLGMLWAALLSLLLAVVFYWTLLRPLVALSHHIVALDPTAPARALLPYPSRHAVPHAHDRPRAGATADPETPRGQRIR
jgi:hypothetical protein